MLNNRKYVQKIAPLLLVVFSMMLTVSHIASNYSTGVYCMAIELEDNAESNEDHKSNHNLKDFKMERVSQVNLERYYFHQSNTYLHLNQALALEVFLEVVTPPPEV